MAEKVGMIVSEEEPRFQSPETAIPTEMQIPCPVCGKKRTFDFLQIEEDHSGCYSVGDEHRFDQCEECGEDIDYGAVWLRPRPAEPREYPPTPNRACMEKSEGMVNRLDRLVYVEGVNLPAGFWEVISDAKAQIRELTESYLAACDENDRLRGDRS